MSEQRSSLDPVVPERSPEGVLRHLEGETDPDKRRLLELVAEHMATEVAGDVDALMDTLGEQAVYHFWGSPDGDTAPKTREDVRAFYEGMVAMGGHRFEFRVERVICDHTGVVTEGTLRMNMPGAAVAAQHDVDADGAPIDPNGAYIAESHLLTVWPASPDGRLLGEDIFFGGDSPPHRCG